jgi:Putative esterase
MRLSLLIILLLLNGMAFAQIPKPASGKIIRWENVSSSDIMGRNVDIWLPDGYSPSIKYAVIYMHDGQMLFDSTNNWNKQEWMVDEVMTHLLKEGRVRNVIVVGIWNNGLYRHAEYYPEKSMRYIDKVMGDSIIHSEPQGKCLSDEYLSFLVKVVKPRVDSTFSTLADKANTFIMGSSMGGLISMYAICEYPGVFGGAACLSTHWPGYLKSFNTSIPESFAEYINANIPSPVDHRIYFDHGTVGLDSLYGVWQTKIDEIMRLKGYGQRNLMSITISGANHSEKAWSNRLDIPIFFLLNRQN